jgi:hypothetical protein
LAGVRPPKNTLPQIFEVIPKFWYSFQLVCITIFSKLYIIPTEKINREVELKLGVLSDTHNKIDNLIKAISIFNEYRVDLLIHCGDVTSLEVLQLMRERPVILTFGNGDIANGDIKKTLMEFNPENVADYSFQGKIGDKLIGVTHGHIKEMLNTMIQSQKLDYIFSGHTHRRQDELIGKTRLINPGALGGMYYQTRSIAVLDLDTDQLVFKDVLKGIKT